MEDKAESLSLQTANNLTKESDEKALCRTSDDLDDEARRIVDRRTKMFSSQETTAIDLTRVRLQKICGLERFEKLAVLKIRNNLVKTIENVHFFANSLRELDLYDNQVRRIDGLSTLVNLESLDLSFNRVKRIENLDDLRSLTKLYLSSNRIKEIENLDKLVNLRVLSLGNNKLRKLQNVAALVNLRVLNLARNKIARLENLECLVNLEDLSMQANRIVKIENLEHLGALKELYLSENGIETIENLHANVRLELLDLATNRIKKIENLQHLCSLKELWLNDNEIATFSELHSLGSLQNLHCLYAEYNPIWFASGTLVKREPEMDAAYRRKVELVLPQLRKLDATLTLRGIKDAKTHTQT